MKTQKITVKVKQRAPRTLIRQRPKAQNISRKTYKRTAAWKKEDLN